MDTDSIFVLALHGNVDCHTCSRPASWWVEWMTFPCRCGVQDSDDLEFAIDAIKSYPEIAAAHALRVKLYRKPTLDATIDALAKL